MKAADVRKELKSMADPDKAAMLQRFFKTGPGYYGEGDIFIGVMVPQSRQIAKKFSQLPLGEVRTLLYSCIHEERLVALLILAWRYNSSLSSSMEKEEIAKFYLEHIKQVNNWDLVDLSAPNILGAHLVDRDHRRRLLYRLAGSENVWERRIAILATLHFIRNDDFSETLKIAGMLLHDRHDLIHKAVGWMLREVGKRDAAAEEAFLEKHWSVMPRTMLRYAIERLPESKRRRYKKKPIDRRW
ncbi:MAG TPA: DNA alkylation repair protein [Nitrososphaera sp.]|jgi:3-methyladenine DNA glycosylase AlkD|nr:DNA alkylation repair protein [Nitrososphaera sp.]